MQNIVLLVLFVLGIVFMQFIKGHTVDEIIDDYIDARGGKEKLNSVKSLYLEGYRQLMNKEIPVKITIVDKKLYRTDFEIDGMSGYLIVTPTQGWSSIPIREKTLEPISKDILQTMQAQLDIISPLVDYAAKGNKAKLHGKETIEERETYEILLTSIDGKETFYYIDTKTKYLIQIKQLEARTDGKSAVFITQFSNYISIEGIMFPQAITNPGSGMDAGFTTFDTIVLNETIGEDQYKPG